MQKDDGYKFLDQGGDNFFHILLTDKSPYPDVEYQYGLIKFIEEHDSLRISFEFEIFDNPEQYDTNKPEFINYIGQILTDNIEKLYAAEKEEKV